MPCEGLKHLLVHADVIIPTLRLLVWLWCGR